MAKVPALILIFALLLLGGAAQRGGAKKGARGPGVAKVQRWLNQPADGIFGRGTARPSSASSGARG